MLATMYIDRSVLDAGDKEQRKVASVPANMSMFYRTIILNIDVLFR